jgi:hypothetical protein
MRLRRFDGGKTLFWPWAFAANQSMIREKRGNIEAGRRWNSA